MASLRLLGVAALAFVISTPNAMAQANGGAGVSSGVRGAVVSELIGWSQRTGTGAKVGVVSEATHAAIDRETKARAQYQTTAEYKNAQHSDFNAARSEVLGQMGRATKSSVEAVIKKYDKPVVGITFPAGWKQLSQSNAVTAVSPDGQVYGILVDIKAARTKENVIRRLKLGLETNFLNDVRYDEPQEAKGGATVFTGSAKGKKSGVDVVFATGIFASGDEAIAATFIADSKIEDYYKETIRGICQTIRRAEDFPQ